MKQSPQSSRCAWCARAAVLRRPSNPSYKNLLRRYDQVVRATGIQVVIVDADSSMELVAAFESTKKERLQGLIAQADDLFIREAARIVHRSQKRPDPIVKTRHSQLD